MKYLKSLNSNTLVICTLLLLSACSTTPNQSGLTGNINLSTGIALPTEMISNNEIIGQGNCSALINPVGSLKSYQVDLGNGADIKFVEMPEGFYLFKQLTCGLKSSELQDSKFPHFQVYAGKISMLQGIHVHIHESGNQLTYSLSTREQTKREALSLIEHLTESAQKRLVSGYTEQPISYAGVQKSGHWKQWNLAHSGAPFKTSPSDWPSFGECFGKEQSRNPLWLGEFEVTANYKNHAVSQEAPIQETWNTFSEPFQKCVISTLKKYHPPKAGELNYRLYL